MQFVVGPLGEWTSALAGHPVKFPQMDLWTMFDGNAGLLLGRSAAPEPADAGHLTYVEALRSALAGLPCPVLHDVDIGHHPPQFTLINGALARVRFEHGAGTLTQEV